MSRPPGGGSWTRTPGLREPSEQRLQDTAIQTAPRDVLLPQRGPGAPLCQPLPPRPYQTQFSQAMLYTLCGLPPRGWALSLSLDARRSTGRLDSGLPSGHTCWALPRPGGGAAVLRHPRPPPGSSRQWGGAGRDRKALGVSLRPGQTPRAPPRSAAWAAGHCPGVSSALSLCPLRTRQSPGEAPAV